MDLLKLKGTPRQVGRDFGEAYRDGFRFLNELAHTVASERPHWLGELPVLAEALRTYLPRFWDELVGMSEGSGLSLDDQLLNHRYGLQAEAGCTNVAFLDVPSGPIFGKNLDLQPNPVWPFIIRWVQYENGDEIVHTTWVGDIMARETCMNMHGLTVGGSSVGSVFQQSLDHPSIDASIYSMICSCRSTPEAIRFIQRHAHFGKGYNFVLVDAQGEGVVLECACPLVQVRRREPGEDAIFCTNIYKLPALLRADRRTPEGRRYSELRYDYLTRKLFEERMPHTVEQMQALLSAHGADGGLCRPINEGDYSRTRFSIVALPAERQLWLADGRPCDVPFERYI